MGTPNARDLAIPGRELEGIYLALQFLGRQNRIVSGEESPDEAQELSASGKDKRHCPGCRGSSFFCMGSPGQSGRSGIFYIV